MSDLARRPDLPVVTYTVRDVEVEGRRAGPDWVWWTVSILLIIALTGLVLSL